MKTLYPGTRIFAFDSFLFKDDISTPLSYTTRSGTVTCWYGYRFTLLGVTKSKGWIYPDCVDIKFDHREQISHGHFSDGVTVIDEN